MNKIFAAKKLTIEISLLTFLVSVVVLLFAGHLAGGKAAQALNDDDTVPQGKDCPRNINCDALVRSIAAVDDRDGTIALRGERSADGGIGVLGLATRPSGTSILGPDGVGVEGRSTSGIGVRGFSTNATGVLGSGTIGVAGSSTATPGTGVSGSAPAGNGVSGFGTTGVFGSGVTGVSGSGSSAGVHGQTTSFSGAGVLGLARSTGTMIPGTGQNFGVRGESADSRGTGVYGLATHNLGENVGVRGESKSSNGVGVAAVNTEGGIALLVSGSAVFEGDFELKGNILVNGAKSSVAELPGGKRVALYAVESPENWFEDFGAAQLQKGAAVVRIPEDFAQTVNTGMGYHLFLTPKGNCNGLYVAKQTPTSFEVRELNGGASTIAFDYRIVARRKGHERHRLGEIK